MNKPSLYFLIIFIFLIDKSFSQGDLLTEPRLEVDGNKLIISYDLITKRSSDQFYIWVEIEKTNGEKISPKSLSGDIGGNIKAGSNKKIVWDSERDSIFFNEDIFVEVKAEKYVKTFNKSSAILKSAVFPGWGQTVISKGKPWWIAGVATYGALAGGYLYHRKYVESLELYRSEKEEPSRRDDLYNQAQKQMNTSTALLYSAATIWVVNIVWVALVPNGYKPLQQAGISLNPVYTPFNKGMLLSIKIEF